MVEIEIDVPERPLLEAFAVAVSAASATIGPIIPPSIPMVLYALVSGASVGALFLEAWWPGLLMAAADDARHPLDSRGGAISRWRDARCRGRSSRAS